MNKADISGRVAARLRLGKAEAEVAVDTVFEAIGESLAREEAVRIAGFGTFATRSREARRAGIREPGRRLRYRHRRRRRSRRPGRSGRS